MPKIKNKRTVREMSKSTSPESSPSKKHKKDTAVVLYEGSRENSSIDLDDGGICEGTAEACPSSEVVSEDQAKEKPNLVEPPSHCPRCKENHWLKDCPKPKKSKKRSKAKRKEKETEAPSKVPKKTKVPKEKQCRRESAEDSPYADGTFVIIKVPEKLGKTFDEVKFAQVCVDSGMWKNNSAVGRMSKNNFYIQYENVGDASSVVGKQVTFPAHLGLSSDVVVQAEPYYKFGPQAYVCDRCGPYSQIQLQTMLEQKFPDTKYWMGKKTMSGFTLSKRLVLFEKPQNVYSFNLGPEGGFCVKFRAMTKGGVCDFCDKGHEGGVIQCASLMPCAVSEVLKGRLTQRPVV